MKRVALLAMVAAAVLAPGTAVSATHHAVRIRLALVPLQKAQLGSAGASLALDYGSGAVFRRNVGLKAFDVRQVIADSDFRRAGRVAHYALDYGDSFTGSTGVMEISSGVEEYKSPAYAKNGLALWRHVDSYLQRGNPGTWKKLSAPPVGQRSSAYLGTWAAPGLNPIVSLDEHVTVGRFVLDLTVTAGSASAAEGVAPRLLRVLNHRLRFMLGGHLTGNPEPAKLPPGPHAGQVLGGPDLSTMTLQPSDVDPGAAYELQAYVTNAPALSAYLLGLSATGPYYEVDEETFWWPTATEATYAEAYVRATFVVQDGAGSDVDLSSVGDSATGILIGGSDGSVVAFTLTNGQAGAFVVGFSSGGLQDSDVQSVAQAAANRLDAGLGP